MSIWEYTIWSVSEPPRYLIELDHCDSKKQSKLCSTYERILPFASGTELHTYVQIVNCRK